MVQQVTNLKYPTRCHRCFVVFDFVVTTPCLCHVGGAGDGEGVEGGDSDWDDAKEAAFQEEKQLAYEVCTVDGFK